MKANSFDHRRKVRLAIGVLAVALVASGIVAVILVLVCRSQLRA